MKISENTRVAKAGVQMAKAIIEMVHLFYLDDNALEFLQTIIKELNLEFEKRKDNATAKKKK